MNRIESALVQAARVGRRGFRLAAARVAPWVLGMLAVAGCTVKSEDARSDGGAALGNDAGGAIVVDGGDTAADGSTQGGDDASTRSDAAAIDGSAIDGSPGTPAKAGCIKKLGDVYVVRDDEKLLLENNGEHTIFDANTGLALVGVQDVRGGDSHGCAVVNGGGVRCFQTFAAYGNTNGQLGNGTTTANPAVWRATPVLTAPGAPLANASRVMASGSTTCAVTTDKKLWCWGDLSWLVNNGTALSVGYAQAITTDGAAPLTGVLQAAIGSSNGCAVVEGTPNAVYCWGRNSSQQLGQGDTNPRQYPVKVLGLASPTKVAISPDTVCAMDGDGVRCWGSNFLGASGTNSPGTNSTGSFIAGPTPVVTQNGTSSLGGVVDIASGNGAFAVLRTDGSLWTWGRNANPYAGNFGVTNVVDIGFAGSLDGLGNGTYIRYLTSDGVYHSGNTAIPVNCGVL